MSKRTAKVGLFSRILHLNAEKIVRHTRWSLATMKAWGQHLAGRGYPVWIDTIQTHVTFVEKQTLYNLARGLAHEAVVVEIGSYHGASSVCLASGVSERNGHVYCIDTWMNDAVTDTREEVLPIFLRNVGPVKAFITEVQGFSDAVVSQIPDQIQLLFVDGDHSYEGVRKDLATYLPKMAASGLVALHDFSHDAVSRAIADHVSRDQAEVVLSLKNLLVMRMATRRA